MRLITLRKFFEDELEGLTIEEAIESLQHSLALYGPEAKIHTAWIDRDEFKEGILTICRVETEAERAARIEAAGKAAEARAIRLQKDLEAQDMETYLRLKERFERNS